MTAPEGTARRGRRDPQMAAQLQGAGLPAPAMDGADLADPGEPIIEDELVYAGDILTGKVTHTVNIDGTDSWVTYGLQTRVGNEETEEQAFSRVATVVNGRAIDLAMDAMQRVHEAQDQVVADGGRITPRYSR